MPQSHAENKTAVVTGASRGLGYGTAEALAEKGFEVIFAARKPSDFEARLQKLNQKGLKVSAMTLDTSSEESIKKFTDEFSKKHTSLNVLVNNAGIMIDDEDGPLAEKILKTFKTNTLGPFLLTKSLWAHLQKATSARVVNVSSGMGQLTDMSGGSPAYRISKTALNAVTRIFAGQGGGTILVNSVCPGWVKTDMGGAGATRTIEQGISGIVWAATLPEDGPNGLFFRDGKRLDW
jgi:NAD(P)-dependent dehydrogenase (short-subunit alcohol dehydrogenase family)